MKKTFLLVSAIAATGSLSIYGDPARAQTPTRIKQHNAWGAYSHNGDEGKVCYVMSVPKQMYPPDRDHGDVYFMLVKLPDQNINLEPQFAVGYPFADNSQVTLKVGGKEFSMFTKGSHAWMSNSAEEPLVVAAMRSGSSMSVSGTSRRGTETSYSYSLSGVTASLKEIENCK